MHPPPDTRHPPHEQSCRAPSPPPRRRLPRTHSAGYARSPPPPHTHTHPRGTRRGRQWSRPRKRVRSLSCHTRTPAQARPLGARPRHTRCTPLVTPRAAPESVRAGERRRPRHSPVRTSLRRRVLRPSGPWYGMATLRPASRVDPGRTALASCRMRWVQLPAAPRTAASLSSPSPATRMRRSPFRPGQGARG